MKLSIITTLVIAIGFITITVAEAKIYSWTDISGEKHYSSTPPKPTEKVSNLKDDLRLTDNKFAAIKVQIDKKSLDKRTKPERMNGSASPLNIKTSLKRNLCRSQRRNLGLLKKNRKVNWVQNGKSTTLNSEQRTDKIRILEDSIRMDCSFEEDQRDRKPNALKKQQER